MLDRVNYQAAAFKKSGIRRFAEAAMARPEVISLTVGEPEFNTDESIKEALIQALHENHTHYPLGQGIVALREAIAQFEFNRSVMQYKPEEIIITNGSTEGLAAVFLALLNEGDEVIVPEPMYISYKPMIEYCKAKLVSLDTSQDDFQIHEKSLENLITKKTKMILITSPNNPTGVVLNQESLEAVKKVVLKYRLFVVSDDVYEQLVYTDAYHKLSEDSRMRPHLVITQSFSKPYAMTGWRVGYLMADLPIATHITKLHAFLVGGISNFSQHACIKALQLDTTPIRDTYAKRLDRILKRLDDMNITYVKPEGAFYVFFNISEFNMDSESFCLKALDEYDLALVPGVYFGDHCDHFVRLSYATSDENIDEGLNRLERMANDLRP